MNQLPIKIMLSGRQYGPRHSDLGFNGMQLKFWQNVFRKLPDRETPGLIRISFFSEVSGEFDQDEIITSVGKSKSYDDDFYGVELYFGPENHLLSKSEYMLRWVGMLKEGTRKIMTTYAERLASLYLDLEELIALYDPALEEVLGSLD